MNSQSVTGLAIEAKTSLNGPTVANCMKPWLGVPPSSHERLGSPSATAAPVL